MVREENEIKAARYYPGHLQCPVSSVATKAMKMSWTVIMMEQKCQRV